MFNPTWAYVGVVYAALVALARRAGLDLPKKIGVFFYALVFVFFFAPLTQDAVNLPVDFLKTLPPWAYVSDAKAVNPQMNDIALQIVPWAHQVREAWRSLQPPLWNPLSATGYPLLASAQSSALSPLRILGLPLSLGQSMTFEASMKILLALSFMYLWCRRRGYSEIASAAGAVAFGFSTFLIVWLHFPLATTACMVPAVFLVIDLLVERVTYPRFVAGAVVWAVMLFGGHPETASHTFFVALLYLSWAVFVERRAPKKIYLTAGASLAVAALLAAPLLAPFAEAVTKSKRYQDLQSQVREAAVPFSDLPSAMLLVQPQFFGELPLEPSRGPSHAESISGFAGILGIAAWIALLVHVVTRRKWRSREFFFVLATLVTLGIILNWPGIADAFHLLFQLAANARMRLFLALLLAMQTAAAIDLLQRDRKAMLIGIASAGALLVAMTFAQHGAPDSLWPSAAVLALAAIALRKELAVVLVLVAITAELWEAGYDWNPVVSNEWMYPKTPLLEKLDELRAQSNEPFRIVANGPAFFPNVSAVYGYEDIRAHDPMANGRYIGLLSLIINYDAANYFAEWNEFEKHFLDFLNVRYVIGTPRGQLPPRYALLYDGPDGRIFENLDVLPRFYAARNVVLEFRDEEFYRRLKELEGWSHTAILDNLKIEAEPQQRKDFFDPRPDEAPVAQTKILEAAGSEYRLHVNAPRWSLIVSSVPWWPGWKVERNGARIEPIRVNGGFLGFAVPPGELDVRVWYDPWSFRGGALVSLATLLALAAYGFRK